MKYIKFLFLVLLIAPLLLSVGCAPKGAMSDLMREEGYGQQEKDPFDRDKMIDVNAMDFASRLDPNYKWQKTLSPTPGDIDKYARKLITWRVEGKSYFASLEEFREAGKSIHSAVQKNLDGRGIKIAEGEQLYYYTLKSFAFDKDVVVGDMRTVMKTVLKDAGEMSVTPLVLIGYADEIGSEKYNIVLSEKRARALELEFEKLGLDTSKLEILAGGETVDYGAHAENRRGVLVCLIK